MTLNVVEQPQPYSSTPELLRSLADRIDAGDSGPSWDSDLCRSAAAEIELYMGMIVGGPIELPG